jgi:hypothetical protein
MWSAFRQNYGFNAFGLRFDALWTRAEKYTALKGKDYTLVALAPRYLSSPRLLKLLSRMDRVTPEVHSCERLQVSENSKLLYYSPQGAKYMPLIRYNELFMIPGTYIFSYYWVSIALYAGVFAVWQPMVYSFSRHFVIRMDLIPSQEAILFHKVGIFGLPRTELVPIKNLQKLDPLHSKFQRYFRRKNICDDELLFKDVKTTCEYGFDRNGVWLDENLTHELIA